MIEHAPVHLFFGTEESIGFEINDSSTNSFARPTGQYLSTYDYLPKVYHCRRQISIVHLSFSYSCSRGDYLKVFLHLEGRGVSEYTPWSGLLCGNLSDIPQVLYSSRSTLVLEFHTVRPAGNATGFTGTFRYIDRRE